MTTLAKIVKINFLQTLKLNKELQFFLNQERQLNFENIANSLRKVNRYSETCGALSNVPTYA